MQRKIKNWLIKKLGGYTRSQYEWKTIAETERDQEKISELMKLGVDEIYAEMYLNAFPHPLYVPEGSKLLDLPEIKYPGAIAIGVDFGHPQGDAAVLTETDKDGNITIIAEVFLPRDGIV